MDEIMQQISKIFEETQNVENEMLNDFEKFKIKLNCIVIGKENKTPQQKKKIKRLSVIIDSEENDKNASELINNESTQSNATSQRTTRAFKLKLESMKNDTIKTKAENRSSSNFNSRSWKRSIENESSNKNNLQDASKKTDESLLILSNSTVPIVELSEDESDKMMPPPSGIPKKKTNRKTKQLETSSMSTRSSRLRIKTEKLSLENSAEKIVESVETESKKIDKKNAEIKEENTEEPPKPSSRRGKSKRTKKSFKCMPIKRENSVDDQDIEKKCNENDTNKTIRNKETVKQTSIESIYEDAVSENIDKQSLNDVNQQTITTSVNPVVEMEQLKVPLSKPLSSLDMPADTTFISANNVAVAENDATFISAKDVPVAENDATFVTTSCPHMINNKQIDLNDLQNVTKDTNKIEHISSNMAKPMDATFNVNNETFKAPPAERNHKIQQEKVDLMQSSIMTEDDSVDELMAPPPPTPSKLKSRKEIFNPFVQSPVKKKVEAFEKHASAIASPLIMSRMATKAKAKENADPEPIYAKCNTPLLKRDLGKLLTPTQHANITPNMVFQHTKYLASNSVKLLKPMKSAAISKSQSLSRENSVEDVKRIGYSKLQLLADEKKKKREQKQQQAALIRETREKERAEKLKKAMQEREEKLRRKAQDLDQKKQLEEINKNLKLQEEKREAQKRLGKKQLELEMAETARKEREMLDDMKIQKAKEELQQKLLQNQKILEEKKAKKTEKPLLKYDFHLLNSDDSTDDEGKTNSKRPPPPSWSKSTIRQILVERQENLDTKIIDSFFSVQPMTPDLREIFPVIDPRYLKRNSSAFWNTPPRYSELPKY